MTAYQLRRKREEFKFRVLEVLKDPTLSYAQVGDRFGISGCRVYQIRKESGVPNRVGGYPKPKKPPVEARPDSPTEARPAPKTDNARRTDYNGRHRIHANAAKGGCTVPVC